MHISVMKKEIVDYFSYLKNVEQPIFVDGTFGMGGHSLLLSANLKGKDYKIIGFDKDLEILEKARELIPEDEKNKFILINSDFKEAKAQLSLIGIEKIDGALLDLGISSLQIDSTTRGFSFKNPEAPLDMRMDKASKIDTAYILNTYPKERLAYILQEYGEEKFANNIAKNIAKIRVEKKFENVGDLLEAISQSIPEKFKHSKIHYATKSFQALRIEVNQELDKLDKAIADFVSSLNPGGRIAVISFHSLEDRIIKNTFKALATGCICPKEVPICQCNHQSEIKLISKKPILPTEEEIGFNPRSRSAKLRIAEKL